VSSVAPPRPPTEVLVLRLHRAFLALLIRFRVMSCRSELHPQSIKQMHTTVASAPASTWPTVYRNGIMLAISDTGDTGAPEPRWPTSSDRRPPYRDAAPPPVCTFPFCSARRRLSALDTAFFLARGDLCATRRRILLFVRRSFGLCGPALHAIRLLAAAPATVLLARSLRCVAAAQSPSDCKSNGFDDRYSSGLSHLCQPLTDHMNG
jgi:hypothetical protein